MSELELDRPIDPVSARSAGSILTRHHVRCTGRGQRPMVLAHGFGCDQNMWRFVAPAFEADHRVVLFDHVGAGRSDLRAYDRTKYATLDGYASDILEICAALDLEDVVLVGHSVSAMIGALAAAREPDRFGSLVMIGPSPCYLNDGAYRGGFEREAILELLEFLDANYLGWARAMAPTIMGNADRPALAEELENSFCRTDPTIAKQFARVTFLSDNRADLARVPTPTLVLQCSEDAIAPPQVGAYVQRQLPRASVIQLAATGHCPHLSHPDEVIAAIRRFLASPIA